jgi:hypothetical protein
MHYKPYLLHPEVEIAVITWSDGSVNKFYACDKEDMDDLIAAKQSWYEEEMTYEIKIVKLKELYDNEGDERKV